MGKQAAGQAAHTDWAGCHKDSHNKELGRSAAPAYFAAAAHRECTARRWERYILRRDWAVQADSRHYMLLPEVPKQ